MYSDFVELNILILDSFTTPPRKKLERFICKYIIIFNNIIYK